MSIVLEKNGKYVLKVYSYLDKAVQLTENKHQAKTTFKKYLLLSWVCNKKG